jgi:hypothetical protein
VSRRLGCALFALLWWGIAAETRPVQADLPPRPGHFSEQQKLVPITDGVGDSTWGDGFGTALALEGDVLVVGAPWDNYPGLSYVGSVYVYERSPGGTWILQQKIFPRDPEGLERFGSSLSLSGDTLVVGAPSYYEGAVYIFSKVDGEWREQSRIEWYGLEDAYGASVALSGDTLAVGAPAFYITLGFTDVFVRKNSRWSRRQRLDTDLETLYVSFGATVGFSEGTLLVGAPGAGVIVLFRQEGRRWVEAGRLTPHDHDDFDQFGRALALSGDTLIVGAPSWLQSSVGGAYVFVGGGASWAEQQKLVDPEPGPGRRLGWAVAVWGDTALVATTTWGGGAGRGSVLSFERTGTVWGLRQRIKASDGTRRDAFGTALALGPDIAVVGAPGAAYVLARAPSRSTK